jgi:GT2 family glycosyltransferase
MPLFPINDEDSGSGHTDRPLRVLAAIVTHNRIKLLQQSIQTLRLQTHRAECMLVVDNSSTDGTREWLDAQGDLTVIRQPNSGSAGGTFSAAKFGYEEGFDWIWMMDDDTAPRPNALERLIASPAITRPDTGFVYSLQVYPDGTVPTNDPGPTGPQEWALSVLQDRCVPVKRCSFVAVMVSRRAVAKVGYPMKEMFFMWDDHEYTRRIVEAGFRGYCVLDSIVLHDTKLPLAFDTRSWSPLKKRYSSRNSVYYIRTSSDPWPRKAWLIARQFQIEFFRLFRGTSNLSVIAWLLKGFFFNPKAERPGDCP